MGNCHGRRRVVSKKEKKYKQIEMSEITKKWKTGDIIAFKKTDNPYYYYGIIARPASSGIHEPIPAFLVYGVDHDINVEQMKTRVINIKSVMTAIFYSGFDDLMYISVNLPESFNADLNTILEAAEYLRKQPVESDLLDLMDASNEHLISVIMNRLTLKDIYEKIGLFQSNKVNFDRLSSKSSADFLTELSMTNSYMFSIFVPNKNKLCHSLVSPAPLLSKLIGGIIHDNVHEFKDYDWLADTLNTGDLVLMGGVTKEGLIIKIFDNEPFTHIGIVLRSEYTKELFVWESSTNRANLPDLQTGKVSQGVEVLPLKQKIFSGWYNIVAFRRLVDVSAEDREGINKKLYEFMNEMCGRPYEESKIEMILSSIDFLEDKIDLFSNKKEDLSSLFCSEAVAAALQKAEIIGSDQTSNRYSLRDFHSKNADMLRMLKGSYSEEIYVKLKLE